IRCAGMALHKYQWVALSLTSGVVPCRTKSCYHTFQTIQKRYLVSFFICDHGFTGDIWLLTSIRTAMNIQG
ncbi:hypothetical protein BDB01DRAFT_786460, partial [Pilobolus umbonatus]